jgi:hypothetical protein
VITFQISCYYEAEQKPKTSYKYDKGDYVKQSKHIEDMDWRGNSVEKRQTNAGIYLKSTSRTDIVYPKKHLNSKQKSES